MSVNVSNVAIVEPVGTNFNYEDKGRTSIDVAANRLADEEGFVSKAKTRQFLIGPNRYTMFILNKSKADLDTALTNLSLSGEYVTTEDNPASATVYREIHTVESVDSQILTDVNNLLTAEFSELTFISQTTFSLFIPFPESMTQERLLRAIDLIKKTVEDVTFLAKNRQTQLSFGRLL